MATMSPLRRSMIDDMTTRNLSPATRKSYLNAVSRFSRHFGLAASPWPGHGARLPGSSSGDQDLVWPSLNQIVCARRFFYGVTLGFKLAESALILLSQKAAGD
jgi:integrase/recombinase XerD